VPDVTYQERFTKSIISNSCQHYGNVDGNSSMGWLLARIVKGNILPLCGRGTGPPTPNHLLRANPKIE